MQLNKAIITVGLISLNILCYLPSPALAQSIKQSSKCAATLQSVKNQITQGRRVKVVDISKDDISKDYQSYPENRPFRYLFVLRGAATESVLLSNKLLTSLSRDILTNCSDISKVTFGLDETDHLETFGLISENKIDAFQCVDPGTYKKLPWGYVVCL
ncbi:MAG: hypothetical protein C6Y22_01675 [Hapalosiphonaceae cyanobacterium JJU2]|nr:MAG: hypothetical protein C6Y22_01675 [Hapalosiphonaceae cyanobacterium JJU2]